MITPAAAQARLPRLEALAVALGKEVAILKEGRPLTANEHRAYLDKI
jgi:hypothetical protein